MLAKYYDPNKSILGRKLAEPLSVRPWVEVKAGIKAKPTIGKHWYVVHCAGSPAEKVKEIVKKLGWRMCIPSCMELRAVPKRQLTASQRNNPFPIKRPARVAMFPRYPFLHFDLHDPMRHEVFELFGVQGMICDGSGDRPQPAYMADEVIAAFDATEIDGTIPMGTTVKQLAYAIGENVRITTGPLAGASATVDEIPDLVIEKLDETARIRLLVSLFGRATVVELSLSDIEKLDSP